MVRRAYALNVEGEVEVPFEDALFASLTNKSSVRVRNAFVSRYGPANLVLSAKGDVAFATVRLYELRLRTTIRARDKIITPSFEDTGDIVELVWPAPADMTLVHVTDLTNRGNIWTASTWYLYAFFSSLDVYQLPLANLYNDCHICVGHERLSEDSIQGVVDDGLVRFHQSNWNSHLIREDGGMYKNSQELFRFDSTETGFIAKPSREHWGLYCRKIGTPQLQNVML